MVLSSKSRRYSVYVALKTCSAYSNEMGTGAVGFGHNSGKHGQSQTLPMLDDLAGLRSALSTEFVQNFLPCVTNFCQPICVDLFACQRQFA